MFVLDVLELEDPKSLKSEIVIAHSHKPYYPKPSSRTIAFILAHRPSLMRVSTAA